MQPQGPSIPPNPYGPQPAPGQPPQPYAAGSMPPVPQPQPGQPGNPYAQQPPATPYMVPAGVAGKPPDMVAPPPRPQSPYDFFMNPQKPKPQRKPFQLPGNKVVWVIGGGVALIGLITVVALSAPKEIPKFSLVAVAQAQTETTRLCNAGIKDAKLQPTKGFAYNCAMTQTSQSRQLANQLKKSNVPIGDDILGGMYSAANDSKLKAAKTSSNYDATFVDIMDAQLKKQTTVIKQATASPEANATERELLKVYTESTALLTTQLKLAQ